LNPGTIRNASQGKGKEMKSTVELNDLSKRADVAERNARAFPSIDCNFQTVALPNYRGSCLRPFSSFRNISSEYFRNEARYEFRVEAASFVAIIITAAIPILNNMHALADFLRVIGTL
jgi:hypothetical protein